MFCRMYQLLNSNRFHCTREKRYFFYFLITLFTTILFAQSILSDRSVENGANMVTSGSSSAENAKKKEREDYTQEEIASKLGCREYPKRGQSCVYGGVSCVDMNESNPYVYFLNKGQKDDEDVLSDEWCEGREKNADLDYWGPRDWPPPEAYAPRQSCLLAQWKNKTSLFGVPGKGPRIRWVSDLAYFNLDYRSNDHNNHYLMDMAWFLDLRLWNERMKKDINNFPGYFSEPKNIFLPQTRTEFYMQTERDVNRLLFALIFGMNTSELYKRESKSMIKRKKAYPLFKAYPSLKDDIIFYGDQAETKSNETDEKPQLLCTNRLVVGAKLGDLGDDEVCNYLRKSSWDLYNITDDPKSLNLHGYLNIHRPPRRVVVLNRHRTRGFKNLDAISSRLQKESRKHSFELEIRSTAELETAEDHVKFFSRVGVLLTTHGSQSMGAMWMPRYSALIEAFPPIYIDYSFRGLARTCNVQFFDLYGKISNNTLGFYKENCEDFKFHQHYGLCSPVKIEPVEVDIEKMAETVLLALRKIGHELQIFDNVPVKEKS